MNKMMNKNSNKSDGTSNNDISLKAESLVHLIGPEINGMVPSCIYEMLRRYGPMFCIDGVPVLSQDEPSVILLKRDAQSVAPHSYWIIGGRVDKQTYEETDFLRKKCNSELGIDLLVEPNDIIGRGRLVFTPDGERQYDQSGKEYTIVTPTHVYALKLPKFELIKGQILPSDGNVKFHRLYGKEIALAEDLHPYVQDSCLVALDRVYGREWRKELPVHLRNKGYIENSEQLKRATFIPLCFDGI
ncbi:MAG: hypothetical protein ACP5NW_02205 [Candidatus Woesearchaeota archaeon]